MSQHRFHHHGMVGEGQGQVNRQAPVCHRLVLAGDCYSDMVPSIIPIWREMLLNPLRPFCNHEECAVRAFPHHIPHLWPPFIRVFVKEVGGKAGVDMGTGRYFVEAFVMTCTKLPDWQVEILSLFYNRRIPANGLIPAEHIAM